MILKSIDKDVDTTQGVEVGSESSSHDSHEHIACSFAYNVVNSVDPSFSRPFVMYRGENVGERFVCDFQLFDESIATPKPMLLTAAEL